MKEYAKLPVNIWAENYRLVKKQKYIKKVIVNHQYVIKIYDVYMTR